MLGAASYFLLPSLGPIYYEPQAFAHLPHSEVTRLQDMLLDQRVEFLIHPATATPQSIAAFASLHISMSLTAALAAHLLGLGRRLKIGLWIWLALTTLATVYLGWHYVLDDLGGIGHRRRRAARRPRADGDRPARRAAHAPRGPAGA